MKDKTQKPDSDIRIISGIPAEESQRRLLGIKEYTPDPNGLTTICHRCGLFVHIGPKQMAHLDQFPGTEVLCTFCIAQIMASPDEVAFTHLGGIGPQIKT